MFTIHFDLGTWQSFQIHGQADTVRLDSGTQHLSFVTQVIISGSTCETWIGTIYHHILEEPKKTVRFPCLKFSRKHSSKSCDLRTLHLNRLQVSPDFRLVNLASNMEGYSQLVISKESIQTLLNYQTTSDFKELGKATGRDFMSTPRIRIVVQSIQTLGLVGFNGFNQPTGQKIMDFFLGHERSTATCGPNHNLYSTGYVSSVQSLRGRKRTRRCWEKMSLALNHPAEKWAQRAASSISGDWGYWKLISRR